MFVQIEFEKPKCIHNSTYETTVPNISFSDPWSLCDVYCALCAIQKKVALSFRFVLCCMHMFRCYFKRQLFFEFQCKTWNWYLLHQYSLFIVKKFLKFHREHTYVLNIWILFVCWSFLVFPQLIFVCVGYLKLTCFVFLLTLTIRCEIIGFKHWKFSKYEKRMQRLGEIYTKMYILRSLDVIIPKAKYDIVCKICVMVVPWCCTKWMKANVRNWNHVKHTKTYNTLD